MFLLWQNLIKVVRIITSDFLNTFRLTRIFNDNAPTPINRITTFCWNFVGAWSFCQSETGSNKFLDTTLRGGCRGSVFLSALLSIFLLCWTNFCHTKHFPFCAECFFCSAKHFSAMVTTFLVCQAFFFYAVQYTTEQKNHLHRRKTLGRAVKCSAQPTNAWQSRKKCSA